MRPQVHPGYIGMFTRDEADGAITNGTKIVKVWCEPSDSHQIGATGTVLGSMVVPPDIQKLPKLTGIKHAYFIEWDDSPGVAVGCIDKKIGPLS